MSCRHPLMTSQEIGKHSPPSPIKINVSYQDIDMDTNLPYFSKRRIWITERDNSIPLHNRYLIKKGEKNMMAHPKVVTKLMASKDSME